MEHSVGIGEDLGANPCGGSDGSVVKLEITKRFERFIGGSSPSGTTTRLYGEMDITTVYETVILRFKSW